MPAVPSEMPSAPAHHPPRLAAVVGGSVLVWGVVAVLATTQQWAELRGTIKEIAWVHAFAWQGVSWLLLVPATPAIYTVVRRFPLRPGHRRHLVAHGLASLAFGCAFLLVSIPARLAFHPSGIRWSLVGEVFYKSVAAYGGAGVLAYGLALLAASHLDARARLYAPHVSDPPRPTPPARITLPTPVGVTHQRIRAVRWAEPDPSGTTLHTDDGEVLIRARLGELEQELGAFGFIRTHRGYLINGRRIRDVIGAPSRDGLVRLDTGETLPVSRRRRAEVDAALAEMAARPSETENGVPLGS